MTALRMSSKHTGQGRQVLHPLNAHLQAALDHSLPIKRTEAGLKTLTLWGKLVTLNGRVSVMEEQVWLLID